MHHFDLTCFLMQWRCFANSCTVQYSNCKCLDHLCSFILITEDLSLMHSRWINHGQYWFLKLSLNFYASSLSVLCSKTLISGPQPLRKCWIARHLINIAVAEYWGIPTDLTYLVNAFMFFLMTLFFLRSCLITPNIVQGSGRERNTHK